MSHALIAIIRLLLVVDLIVCCFYHMYNVLQLIKMKYKCIFGILNCLIALHH
jgi:hypothetical protein